MTQRRPSAFKTFRCVRIVSTSASSLIGSTIPLVPSTEIPPSIPRTGLKVFFAASTPAGILIVTRTDLTSPASSRSASTASRIIFLGTELIAAAPTGWSSPGFVTRPIPMPPSITICGILLTGLGIWVTPYMLEFMSTPEDVLPSASVYLEIYFSGVFGLLVYNMGSAILRAVGDTKRPLYFLCLSSVMNIALDLLFVVGFGMAIEGVAYATIISQFISAALVLVVLSRSTENYRLTWRDLRIDKGIFKQILMIGLPTGFQQSLTSFSNVYVQSYINTFGSSCMAGWSSYSKIDQFVFLPMQSIGQASTTFMSQNLGAGNLPRAKKGTGVAMRLALIITFASAAVLFLFAPSLVAIFNQEPDVVRYGTMFLRMNVFMLAFCCPNQVVAGAMRGAGDSRTPMLIMLFSFVLFRQIYLYIATSICNTAAVVGFGYPVGWIVASVLVELYYMSGKWEKKINM